MFVEWWFVVVDCEVDVVVVECCDLWIGNYVYVVVGMCVGELCELWD